MSEDICLRIVENDDLSFLHKLFNNPDVMDFWFSEPYVLMESLQESLKEKNDQKRIFIITNSKQEQIGLVGLYDIEHRHRYAEFAIALDPEHQGKGYATIATKLMIDYAFLVLNLHKVYLIVIKANEKAIHIYKKIGFQVEGNLSKHFYINGAYYDGLIMGIFKDNYKEIRKKIK